MNEQDRKEAVRQTRPNTTPAYTRWPDDLPPGDNPAGVGMPIAKQSLEGDTSEETENEFDPSWAIRMAASIYSGSTDYIEANILQQWEQNIAHFRSEHAPGSAYKKDNYRRARTFRPKTRSNVKAQEASAAAAIFSTPDIVDVTPVDKTNPEQHVAAQIRKFIIEHRLGQMPWFLTTIGAYQDTKVYGLCVSMQYWEYRSVEYTYEQLDEAAEGEEAMVEIDTETGAPVPRTRKERKVVKDCPAIRLLEPENFRFDPMADWRDPVNSSPYCIAMIPMYAGEVLEKMEDEREPWKRYPLGAVLAARHQNLDTERTRQAREGNKRTDPVDKQTGNEHTTVWAHLNVVRVRGIDYAWWTLGTQLLMTEVKPLGEMFEHLVPGERPFVMGFSSIEAHRNYPSGDVEQSASLQREINDVANQRLDNVKLALNKRWFIRRGSQVDLDALVRNVPGGGIMVNEPERDVREITTNDVTASSYQEQDRLATDFDELVGGFSQSGSLGNKARALDSAKGMQQMAGSAGAVQDYGVQIFFRTWMTPVLRQINRLISFYENDQTILALAGNEAQLFQKYGQNVNWDWLMDQELLVDINVAIGNADPMRKVERLTFLVANTSALPGMGERMKSDAITDEMFGALGFKNASRFYMTDEELQAKQEAEGPPPEPPEIQVKKLELEIRKADNDARDARERSELELKREIAYAELALKKELTLEEMYTRLGIEHSKLKTQRETTALQQSLKVSELNIKAAEAMKPDPKPAPAKGPPKK